MEKESLTRQFLFLIIFVAFHILVPPSHANEYLIRVDSLAHQKFGLYYPATYKFAIPPGTADLVAQYRYGSDGGWKTLPEKTTSDTFNGIDVVRFDFAGGWAYISISFSRLSDEIHLQIVDKTGQPITFKFDSIPKYYDGRKGAITITLDDWMTSTEQKFANATDILTGYGIYYTVGIITGKVEWSSVQRIIDKNADNLEVATHGVTHLCTAAAYAEAGYDVETAGSRDAIRNNLKFRAHPYVPVYIEPCGYSDDALVSSVTNAGYLLTRKSGTYAGSLFIPWDPTQERYGRGRIVFDDWTKPWDAKQLEVTNALFDEAIATGGVYHLMNHPEEGFWYNGSYLLQHLEYIKGRNDIWYVGLGQLYLYHFLQEKRGHLSVESVEPPPPKADFTASPVTGIAPLSVSFTDTSTGSITGRVWDLGDSTTSTEQNPVHIYNSAGSYSVKLTVTGPGGSNEKVEPNYIVVGEAAPAAAFSATPRTGAAPLTVSFTDTSTGSVTGRLWDFGDSTTSTDQNPVHVYNSTGSYSVKLTVTGPGGSNEKVELNCIVVGEAAPAAAFSATPRTGAAPLTVSFTDASTGSVTGRLWDFGDSTTSTDQNPVHVYNSAGTYSVKLTVTGPGGSNEKVEPNCIVVGEAAPAAAFSATPRTGAAPLTVSFTDASTGSVTGRLWDFGDSTTSTEQNPFHVYNSAGSYSVKLTVTGPGGSNEKVEPNYIVVGEAAPAAAFSATPRTGAAPLTVSFTDTSTGSVTGRLWDFGDSTTSTEQNPFHVYNRAGTYSVKLTVTGPGGSNEKVEPNFVEVSQAAPDPGFFAYPRSGTAPLTVSFTDTSTGLITGWVWDFGDSTTSTVRNPVHVYNTAGSYTVKLTVTSPDGSIEKILPDYIMVNEGIEDYVIAVDASAHRKFGLFYPVTYKFAVPANATGLTAEYRYSTDAPWTTLPEKTSNDNFNGDDAVRFDYTGWWAYVSIGFSGSSDQIYLRVLDGLGRPVRLTFASIPKYYDDRKAAVTVMIDDWATSTDAKFRAAIDYLAADDLYFTVALITDFVDFQSVQQKIDQHGQYLEVASHGASHLCKTTDYVTAGYSKEIIGSRDAIRNNLTFRGYPYVPVFLEPCGYSDATLVSTVTEGDYLLTRKASNYFAAGSTFVGWDSVQGRYGRSAIVFDDSAPPWDASFLSEGNSLFNQTVAKGGTYLLLDHPRAGYWYDGSYLLQHLDYIKGRKDIWYVSLGQLYLYHFLQEMHGNLTVRPVAAPLPGAK